MILEKESLRFTRMADDLMDALAKLGITILRRQKLGSHPHIAGVPRFPAIIGAINASRGNRNMHAFFVFGIRKDCMQAQPSATRLPLRSMRMIVETFD